MIYINKGDEINGIFNLTESHGVGLRQVTINQTARTSDAL